jgi:predicted nucleic acid-binding protein
MKVLDATSAIAFLGELDYPDGLRLISGRHEIVVPSGVVAEIQRARSRGNLNLLIEEKVIRVVEPNPESVRHIRDENPALGQGECEVLAITADRVGDPTVFVISDDRGARSKYPARNYVWTEELIDYMEARGLIDPARHGSLLAQLERSGFYSRTRRRNV